MKKLKFIIPIVAALSMSLVAEETIKVEVASFELAKTKTGSKRGPHPQIRKLVVEYMLDQGDLTVDELKLLKEAKREERKELRALRESGDEEALQARLSELRAAHQERRNQIKAYVAEHQDLADAIDEKRSELRQKRTETKLAVEHMLENGVISQEELDVMKLERKENRKALRELRKSGNEEAWQALHDELHAERDERRQKIQAYIAEHDELAATIEAQNPEQ